ncbi:Phosphotransferase enzyme family protein [Pedococcus cremeus]|uniref:Phosphotransferase enzyme family protein n=1 Tax=Pedococcus cremeus TaxID=587636 RepID=A0A1H9RXJ4_9MICO|nr:macrolide 2'-phosphotransferase [Pedococcus cremeus]SER76619.1 Phosphotransferase enzyme family protein [Pedococcus cremeus]
MDRSPLYLAALASAAVPGLDPASVEALPSEEGQLFDVAFVQDTQHRRWVVRAPRTQAAGAQMDVTVALLGLLSRRLPFAVPTPKGFAALKEGGRAAVYPYLPGQNVRFEALPPGPGLAAELGRTIAHLHNADLQIFDEAGLPAYDPDTYRTRRLAELDRAAATGHVPTALLSRWERMLEDVSLWRFAPTPTHGDLTGDQVLAVFDDEEDAGTGRVRALTGWEDAKVADPADDFAALVRETPPEAFETVLEAYAHARVERPDKHLEQRARLAAEMRLVTDLMAAVSSDDRRLVERQAAALRRLDDRIHAEEEAANDYRHDEDVRPARTGPLLVPPHMADDDHDSDEDHDVALMFAKTAPDEVVTAEPDDEPQEEVALAVEHEPQEEAAPTVEHDPPPDDAPAAQAPEARHDDTAPIPTRRAEVEFEEHDGLEDPGPEFEPGYDVRR